MAPGLVWGINSDVDIIWITSLLYPGVQYTNQCSCCIIFTVFHWLLLQVQEPTVTFSHFTNSPVLLWHGLSGYIHFTHYRYSLYPASLWKLHSCLDHYWAWLGDGCPCKLCMPSMDFAWSMPVHAQQQTPPGLPGWAHWGARYLYDSHQSQGYGFSKSCSVPWGCCPLPPFILLSPLNPTSCTVCQLKDLNVEIPHFPLPLHSNFRHIGFETHAVYCESLLIWGLQVTQLCATASHLGDKWMHCSSADLSGGGSWGGGEKSTVQGRDREVTALATDHTHLGSQIRQDTRADEFSLPITPQLSGYKLWCGKTCLEQRIPFEM